MKNTTTIDGYDVEVEDETTETSQCWVSCKVDGAQYLSSLAALQGEDFLFNSHDGAHSVHIDTIDRITAWAEENGY